MSERSRVEISVAVSQRAPQWPIGGEYIPPGAVISIIATNVHGGVFDPTESPKPSDRLERRVINTLLALYLTAEEDKSFNPYRIGEFGGNAENVASTVLEQIKLLEEQGYKQKSPLDPGLHGTITELVGREYREPQILPEKTD